MITYTEKGAGLHAAIAAAGESLAQINGDWVASDDAKVQLIIDAYSLESAKNEIRAQIDAHAKTLFERATRTSAAAEMAGWPILRAEYRAYVATGSKVGCDAIAYESAVRGITFEQLADKVRGNVELFDPLRAAIAGVAGHHKDAVAGLDTFAQVLAYAWSVGWPNI